MIFKTQDLGVLVITLELVIKNLIVWLMVYCVFMLSFGKRRKLVIYK